MLIENTLFGVRDKVQTAIERIQIHEPPEGYYVAFSGGKDSIVVKDLVQRAGVKYDIHYNLTTVDPPELVYYIRQYHADVEVCRPKETMWELIPRKRMPPTRIARYCCQILKEGGGEERCVVTGVRWAESAKRAKRRMVENCNKGEAKTFLHPIIDWSENEVWEYIHKKKLAYCSIYDEGYKRIGCVMCPYQNAKGMMRDAARWPKIADAYKRAFSEMLKARVRDGLVIGTWQTGEEVFNWWISDAKRSNDNPDQTIIFE